ncbi:fimbria/pilus periplasmic chaperone [Serratia fonticola]|uniref:fimbria/pilus periplasmic chaperone n=1 Tax=Serratia fonticola TaxID=47917 RepID=UPI0021B838E6|nr:fimbria/pilus periplasmic chaperone [Serratia fonticola]
MKQSIRKSAGMIMLSLLCVMPVLASAAGVTLNTTRIIYSQGSHQQTVSVRNSDEKTTFLIQSWVENADGKKTKDFVVTPPLFTSKPGNENMLRLVYSGDLLPQDRESLYFFNSKAIPSVDKEALEGKNALILAAITRIKLFVRPQNLKLLPEAAPAELRFKKEGQVLNINNPTPYYLTLTELKTGQTPLQDIMVAPMSSASVSLPASTGSDVTFSTINDYGGLTPEQKAIFK